jgi:hypothetical protein
LRPEQIAGLSDRCPGAIEIGSGHTTGSAVSQSQLNRGTERERFAFVLREQNGREQRATQENGNRTYMWFHFAPARQQDDDGKT